MRKILITAALACAALAPVAAATAASAGTAPHLTGSVALAGPADQYATLNNIAATASGSLSYTNFNVADIAATGAGSLPKGVAIPLDFNLGGSDYNHTLIVDSIQPTGLASFTFTGHGSYVPDASYTWTATGSVSGEALSMDLTYTGSNAGYTVHLDATINADGTFTGTAASNQGQSFTLSGSGAFQALSFTAPVNSVSFNGTAAQFSSAIPAGHTYAGTPFTEYVNDGGSPGAGHDTWTQNPAGASTITAGNLTVH